MAAGLHGRCRWRLPVLLVGMLFAAGRRTVAAWLRAAGVADDWKSYYYFISAVIRWAAQLAAEAGKRLWIITDGFYVKRPVLKVARALGVVVIGRLRKDAALWTRPPAPKNGQRRGRGRPRKYGRVWVRDGQWVRPIDVEIGPTDGTRTKIIGGDVREGLEVIVGVPDSSNPFAPRRFKKAEAPS